MENKILLLSNYRLSKMIKNNLDKKIRKDIKIINARFDKVLSLTRNLIEKGKVDVIIARNSHVYILKEYFNDSIPIIEINISFKDILNILNKPPKGKTAIVNYKKSIDRLFPELMKNPPFQITFDSIHDLRNKMKKLKNDGYENIIGTSAVCDVAEEYDLNPLFIYSHESVVDAIKQAYKIVEVQNVENKHKNQLKAIINYVYSGIIYVNKNGMIKLFNPVAEKIFDMKSEEVIGKHIERILKNSHYEKIIKSKIPEINQYTKIKDNVVLVSRIPIKVKDVISGVLITFQDIEEIKKSELTIRKITYKKGLTAKYTFNDIISSTNIMKRKIKMAQAYALSNENILLRGETGTGKEIFAQSIHNFSNRSDKPFVAINCAALLPSLLESELFGYEKGSFTGANKKGKIGKFELAHEGTIFLDEIGKMPKSLQSKILRVIEEREIMRIGGEQVIPINVRIISSTNKELFKEIENNNFQRDLYYRLNTLNLLIPPLRKRRADISLLAKYFLISYDKELYEINKKSWNEIFDLMKKLEWKGNVRELKNVIKRINILLDNEFDEGMSTLEILNKSLDHENFSLNDGFSTNERNKILKVLKEEKWNRGKAAEKLNISRTTLWNKMKEFDI